MDNPETVFLAALLILLVLFITRFDSGRLNAASLEYKTYAYVCLERKKLGLPEMTLSAELSEIARKHSSDMAQKGFFDHRNREGKTHKERILQDGFAFKGLSAENLAKGCIVRSVTQPGAKKEYRSLDGLARDIVCGWMKSAGHRKNMLEATFSKTGVGVSYKDETYYFTEVFVEA